MRTLLLGFFLLLLLCGTAWCDPWPNYGAQAGNTITGITVTPAAGSAPTGLTTYYITISSDAQLFYGGAWYPITGVCGLGVYPNAGGDYGGTITFGDPYGTWNLEPSQGTGTTGTNAFGWSGPNDPISTPGTGVTDPIAIGTATFTGQAPPDLQYLLHVYATIGGTTATYWGAPGEPGIPEPASLALLASGMAGFAVARRRKRSAR